MQWEAVLKRLGQDEEDKEGAGGGGGWKKSAFTSGLYPTCGVVELAQGQTRDERACQLWRGTQTIKTSERK